MDILSFFKLMKNNENAIQCQCHLNNKMIVSSQLVAEHIFVSLFDFTTLKRMFSSFLSINVDTVHLSFFLRPSFSLLPSTPLHFNSFFLYPLYCSPPPSIHPIPPQRTLFNSNHTSAALPSLHTVLWTRSPFQTHSFIQLQISAACFQAMKWLTAQNQT